MGEQDLFKIYNVKVRGSGGNEEVRKTIDGMSLLQWIEFKEMGASVLTLDLDKVPEGKGIDYIQAKVLLSNWFELKGLLQQLLGLVKEAEVEQEAETDVGSVTKMSQKQQVKQVPQRQQVKEPEGFDDPEGFGDEEVTL